MRRLFNRVSPASRASPSRGRYAQRSLPGRGRPLFPWPASVRHGLALPTRDASEVGGSPMRTSGKDDVSPFSAPRWRSVLYQAPMFLDDQLSSLDRSSASLAS